LSSKRRVFQIAREFNISIEELTGFLKGLDYKVGSRMSPVTDEMYEKVQQEFAVETQVITDDFDIKKELKERRASEEERKKQELLEYKKRLEISTQVMTEGIKQKKKTPKKPAAPKKSAEEIKAKSTEKAEVKVNEEEKKAKKGVAKDIIEKPDVEKAVKKEAGTKEKISKAKEKLLKKDKAVVSEDKKEKIKKVIKKADVKDKPGADKAADAEKKEPEKKKLKKKDRIRIAKEKQAKEGAVEGASKKVKTKKKKEDRLAELKKTEKARKKSKRKRRFVVSDEEVDLSIKQTLAAMEESKPKKRKKKIKGSDEVEEIDENLLRVNEFITVGELAEEMEVESSEVIKKCMELGLLVTINQRLDKETLLIVADEFGFKVDIMPEFGSEILEDIEDEVEDESLLQHRSPVVTIMGHVDHGKTSLLDYIRNSNIIKGEAGGITQHIGAYQVDVNGKNITFLDTPGHEAFTAMRARGAQATDLVVLIVAADDSVMPQTLEAISHAKAAEVPIIIAINKIDRPNANPDKIKQQLSESGILIEEWGGKYQSVEISAKHGTNVDKLLESILVEAEILELKANPDRMSRGIVIESKLDKGKGVIATVLIQKGTLKIGDPFIVGQFHGKVRSLFNEFGEKKKKVGPSVPIQVTGFTGLPQAGDSFVVLKTEKDTREISQKRQQLKREHDHRQVHLLTLDEISQQIKMGAVKELSLIIKGDVDGSVEAINDALIKLSNDEVTVKVILKGVGGISESDVLLASTSSAIIMGFQVRPTIKAREIAKKEKVDLRLYRVIYDAISDVRDALEGLLEPTIEEENLGTLEIRDIFKVPKIGTIAGCYVSSGKITRKDLIRLYREDKLLFEGKISSLKRFKEDVKEVASGFECGVGLENYNDLKVGDILETYKTVEIKRTLVSNNA